SDRGELHAGGVERTRCPARAQAMSAIRRCLCIAPLLCAIPACTSLRPAAAPCIPPPGGAPYCNSPVLASMSWNWSQGYTQPNGSDLWPVTWGRDGRIYIFFGDGGGFGGDNYKGRTSFGIATLSASQPPDVSSARNLYGGLEGEHPST